MDKNVILPKFRANELVVKELTEERLIYDLRSNKAYCLNHAARLIMDQCDGKTSIDDAVASVNRELDSGLTDEIVWTAIERCQELLNDGYRIPVKTSKVSRRKLLRAAAALGLSIPVVSALVVPMAIHAQSGCVGIGQPCVLGGGLLCCPGLTCFNTESGPTGFQCVNIP